MNRKHWGPFSGSQLTVIALGAMIAPTALYGAVTYSNVSLVNPTTGVAASIDAGGRLTAVDPYSLYKNYSANLIDFTVSNGGTRCESSQTWTVPAGKAFVITAVSGFENGSFGTQNYTGFEIFPGATCGGGVLTSSFENAVSGNAYHPVGVSYGAGLPVPAGATISVYSYNNNGYTHIHGYLVPAAWVTTSQFPKAAALPGLAAKLSPSNP